jgi:nicotinamidase-related amidase
MLRPVLLVVDMVNDFLDGWDEPERSEFVGAANELVQIMRRASRPVIWVRQEFEPDLSDAFAEMRAKNIHVVVKGTSGAQLDARLAVVASDPVMIKKRYSAFFGTDLDEVLARHQPNALVLAGVNTHACIRTTAIDAISETGRSFWPRTASGPTIASIMKLA